MPEDSMRKPVVGFEGRYEADSNGDVISLSTGKAMRPRSDGRGYQTITLFDGKQHQTIKVHRIIAIAFLPNPQGKTQVNHKDFDRCNNQVSNLEWVTPKQNFQHAIKGGRHANPKYAGKGFVATNIKTGEQKTFSSQLDAEREGFDSSTISKCCKGNRKSHKGFSWAYSDCRRVSVPI